MAPEDGVQLVYATYHVDVGETPFFIALDHARHAIVISIRGTLSMKVGSKIILFRDQKINKYLVFEINY